MRREHLMATAGGALFVIAIAVAPHALRRMDTFSVRKVEVRGTRYLAPHEALKASRITRSSNIFDDFRPWRDSLERHPLIVSARIRALMAGHHRS